MTASNDLLHDFEQWAGALLARLAPAERRKFNLQLARELRRRQQARVAEQKNPDGSAWEPRQRLRQQRGRIKRRAKMYMKMRQARHMKIRATADAAIVEFTGHDAWIARVAQYGLVDRVSPNGPRVRYPKRELLGFSDADREWVRDFVIRNLLPGG
jgi:phage virion morphogenesis protein